MSGGDMMLVPEDLPGSAAFFGLSLGLLVALISGWRITGAAAYLWLSFLIAGAAIVLGVKIYGMQNRSSWPAAPSGSSPKEKVDEKHHSDNRDAAHESQKEHHNESHDQKQHHNEIDEAGHVGASVSAEFKEAIIT
jgi:hypothetical protein